MGDLTVINDPNAAFDFVPWLGALVVMLVAMARFNNPRLLIGDSSPEGQGWKKVLRDMLSWKPGSQSILLKPPRANTTAFRYWLYKIFYALIALLIFYLLLTQQDIRDQIQTIIEWFEQNDLVPAIPDVARAEPLVVAAFVVLVLPYVPPFRWGDTAIRTWLYDRALIPAQQLREVNRLKIATYHPPQYLFERAREQAIAEGFDKVDIMYDADTPTTRSLWAKCLLLIEQIRIWEADDHYKTAVAALRDPETDERAVDAIKQLRRDLQSDALVCLAQLRAAGDDRSPELIERESVFRTNCCVLQKKIYTVLAGISLHSHYSDAERIRKFGEFGFELEAESSGPIPDANDMLMLVIIICAILVIPLATKLGVARGISIGAMSLSAVLSPVLLARFCPAISDGAERRYCPNIAYPIFSAALAAVLGFAIYVLTDTLSPPKFIGNCGVGVDRYFSCSYPWAILHAGMALLLAIRLGVGRYPDVRKLAGWKRYRQWGSFTDALVCAVGAGLVAAFIALPLLESLRPEIFRLVYAPEGSIALLFDQDAKEWFFWRVTLRQVLLGFILGFVVPTWYRAHSSPYGRGDRRKDPQKRRRFDLELDTLRQSGIHGHTGGHAAT